MFTRKFQPNEFVHVDHCSFRPRHCMRSSLVSVKAFTPFRPDFDAFYSSACVPSIGQTVGRHAYDMPTSTLAALRYLCNRRPIRPCTRAITGRRRLLPPFACRPRAQIGGDGDDRECRVCHCKWHMVHWRPRICMISDRCT